MSNKEKILEEKTADSAVAKPYDLRDLKDRDLFPILDIIAAVLPDDLSGIFAQLVMGEKSVNEIGGEVVYKIVIAVIKNVSAMPDKIYPLLSDLSGIPADEIPDMPFGTTPNMIWDIVKEAKNASFFAELSKLL
jgi:hypothetical protein